MIIPAGDLGDFLYQATVDFMWQSFTAAGASVTRATNGTISVYKGNNTTQTTTGVTDTEDFDTLTGVHHVRIATTDAFYEPGFSYMVVLSGATIDGQSVNAVLATFSIQNRYEPGLIRRGLAQGGAAGSITLDASASATDDKYLGASVLNVAKAEARDSIDYIGSSKVLAVGRNWVTTPVNLDPFELYAGQQPVTLDEIGDDIEARVPTDAENADKLLGRTITGGADGGRTVASTFARIRNRWTLVGATLTVYATDDATPLWTSIVTQAAVNPITGSDPL